MRGQILPVPPAARDPLCELVIAMCKLAYRDITHAERRGDRATQAEIANRFTAQFFLEECRCELAPYLRQVVVGR